MAQCIYLLLRPRENAAPVNLTLFGETSADYYIPELLRRPDPIPDSVEPKVRIEFNRQRGFGNPFERIQAINKAIRLQPEDLTWYKLDESK